MRHERLRRNGAWQRYHVGLPTIRNARADIFRCRLHIGGPASQQMNIPAGGYAGEPCACLWLTAIEVKRLRGHLSVSLTHLRVACLPFYDGLINKLTLRPAMPYRYGVWQRMGRRKAPGSHGGNVFPQDVAGAEKSAHITEWRAMKSV